MRLIFMGTPEFAVPSLEALVESGFPPVAVVTGPDRPRGRGQKLQPTAVKTAALRLGIDPILQPSSVKDPCFATQLQALNIDLQVVVAFRILPPEVFSLATLGAFNLHASLLPEFRGAAPINWALINGATKTGVTTFFLKDKVDTGNILLQWPTSILPNDTAGILHDRLAKLGAQAVVETTRRICEGRAIERMQDHSLATKAPKIFREDCQIPWTRSAEEVHNHCRGLSPYPGAWTTWKSKVLKCLGTKIAEGSGKPGTILHAQGTLIVACQTDAVEVTHLQAPNQRVLPSKDFLNGHPLPAGESLFET